VRTPFANCVVNGCNALVAGPIATAPEVENCEPWHGHTNRVPENPVTVQPSCVHVAVSAVKVSWPVCATKNVPNDVCTIAIEPTAASADAASIVTDTMRPATAAAADGSCDADVDEGDVELPPQAATELRASIEAA
jgi:hypothetical protein